MIQRFGGGVTATRPLPRVKGRRRARRIILPALLAGLAGLVGLLGLLGRAALAPQATAHSVTASAPAGSAGSIPRLLATGEDEPSVLVVNQPSPAWPAAGESRGRRVEMLLRHFTAKTSQISAAAYAAGRLDGTDYVVVVANDAQAPLPPVLLDDLARTTRPVLWIGYGLEQLPVDLEETFGIALGYWTNDDLPDRVSYGGQSYPAHPIDYRPVEVVSGRAEVLASYSGQEGPIPYVLRSANLWYVNGLTTLAGVESPALDPQADAPTLIVADLLHDFLGLPASPPSQAVIFLENVAVPNDPARLQAAIDLLRRQDSPFVLGLVPEQGLAGATGGQTVPLRTRPELVRALRAAQGHGGTIALYRPPDTTAGGEGPARPDGGGTDGAEAVDRDAAGVGADIGALRDLGLEPRLWWAPDAARWPATDGAGRYFTHAIADRAPVFWLPYPAGPDDSGQLLISRALGSSTGRTVAAQLEQAHVLKIVRGGWAVATYEPERGSLADLAILITGLREAGYTFVDLRRLPMKVDAAYQPSWPADLATWLTVDVSLLRTDLEGWLQELTAWWAGVERFSGWWAGVERFPWWTLLSIGASGFFLVRLREQWRPIPAAARSLVEGGIGVPRRGYPWHGRRLHIIALLVFAGLAAATSAGAVTLSSLTLPRHYNLTGWSKLHWAVPYDGYGSVGIEADGSLRLAPLAATQPHRTHAALALAGDPSWEDYVFTVRMMTYSQLRQGTAPNPWEAGWLFFRYQGGDRSYYLVHKTNGLELGKLGPPLGRGQVFLMTVPEGPAELSRWYEYKIDVKGPTIRVYVDGQLVLAFTDPDPIRGGRVGLYSEDADVRFFEPAVTLTPAG